MGRGLFLGALWGSLVAVMSLLVLSQVGGMVGLLEEPTGVAIAAPEVSGGDTVAVPDEVPAEPAASQQPDLQILRGSETPAPAAAAEDPSPTAQTAALPSPDAVETIATPAQPTPDADVETPMVSDTSGQNTVLVANGSQPVSPDVDALPQSVPSAPEPQQTPVVEIETQAPVAPIQPSEVAEATIETAVVVAPVTPGEPDQPVSPNAETAPGVAPGGDFANPVVVPTPVVVPEETPVVEPDEPATTVAQTEPAPAPVPNAEVLDGDGQLESQGALENMTQNVRINRLPSIGTSSETLVTEALPTGEAPAGEITVGGQVGSAMQKHSQAFENPENRPMMAILLLPDPAQDTVGDTPLPFAVNYVVDASRDDAAQRMRMFRDGGFEVAALMPLPEGATPQDVETSFQIYFDRVSEAVAVIDTEQAEFQSGRAVASQVVQVLAASGHGMITYSKGLNSAPQLAEREGVPAALVFRDFDSNGQDIGAIKRFLDQAAFRAGQQSGVILVGHNRPDTVKALLEWSLGNRANTVALAPVSAVLLNQ